MVKMVPDLIRKYDIKGPRYTSYPTAVQFRENGGSAHITIRDYLRDRNRDPRPISLYVHIPFCFSLCWYCGCTKIITKDAGRGDHYIDYLEKEMDLLKRMIHPDSLVTQIHFGGGTPTFLKPGQLLRLGQSIQQRFNVTRKTEFSVEIDPRRCNRAQIHALKAIGCTRASLGVQDTNPEVQKAIHRIQPFEQTETVTRWLREVHIRSVNFDLIYGLPKQTAETFRQTMEDVLTLSPDRLAVYSYAHVPDLMPSQKLLNEDDMPTTDRKLDMLRSAIGFFTGRGYRYIGMDHFARENDELSVALREGTLQRNFQGYSTLAGTDLYGFGMSAISSVNGLYWQNSKDIGEYYRCLDNDRQPVAKECRLTHDDLIRRDVIHRIMCRMGVEYGEVEQKWGISFPDYFSDDISRLADLERDGLVKRDGAGIRIPERGRLFLRNIALCFDRYMHQGEEIRYYSKTV